MRSAFLWRRSARFERSKKRFLRFFPWPPSERDRDYFFALGWEQLSARRVYRWIGQSNLVSKAAL